MDPLHVKRDEHVNTERRWEVGETCWKAHFSNAECSDTCSQTRHVGSMFDEDRDTSGGV